MVTSWKWIAVGIGAAAGLGLLWIIFMRFFAGIIVWGTIIIVYALFIAATVGLNYFTYRKK